MCLRTAICVGVTVSLCLEASKDTDTWIKSSIGCLHELGSYHWSSGEQHSSASLRNRRRTYMAWSLADTKIYRSPTKKSAYRSKTNSLLAAIKSKQTRYHFLLWEPRCGAYQPYFTCTTVQSLKACCLESLRSNSFQRLKAKRVTTGSILYFFQWYTATNTSLLEMWRVSSWMFA